MRSAEATRRAGRSSSASTALRPWYLPAGAWRSMPPEDCCSSEGAMPRIDAAALEIANHRLGGIAEEMGVVLGRTALSPNIKERRDYSCAVFDARGGLVAQAAHIPVHLGSTPMSVRAAIAAVDMEPGDVVVLNDPFAGGTHLPDVTVVAPVHLPGARRPFAFVANRAHHADIGGMEPGSMPVATDIYQEGVRIPPIRLVRRGAIAR